MSVIVAMNYFCSSYLMRDFVVSVSSLEFTDEPRILSTLFWLNDQGYYFTLCGHSLNPDCKNESNILFNLCQLVKSAVRHFRPSQSWHCFAFKTAAKSRFFFIKWDRISCPVNCRITNGFECHGAVFYF